MIIQHNMQAMNANRELGITNAKLSKTSEKLSSGYRINRAADDAAGLSISEKMRGQIRGLNQASRNTQDGVSLVQTAEGALAEVESMLQRMRELVVQASNDTNTDDDISAIQKEINELLSEIDRIATSTEFNSQKLLNGDFKDKKIQVAANANQTITIDIEGAKVANINNALSGLTLQAKGSDNTGSIETVNDAIKTVSELRSRLGAIQNRLEHSIAVTDNTAENLQTAESKIRDVDMAEAMVEYSKDNIMQQAAQSILAQANQSKEGVLSLLQ